jgi:hypothetical protein
MQRFAATLTAVPGGGHFVVVPVDVANAVGLRYGVRVRGTVNGVAYRSSLMKYSGVFHMGVHEATIAAARTQSGEQVDVAVEIDDEPLPTDTVPRDLSRAIAANPKARDRWATLPPSHRREHVKHVTEAKKPETRARRIEQTVAALAKRPKATKPRARTARAKPATK